MHAGKLWRKDLPSRPEKMKSGRGNAIFLQGLCIVALCLAFSFCKKIARDAEMAKQNATSELISLDLSLFLNFVFNATFDNDSGVYRWDKQLQETEKNNNESKVRQQRLFEGVFYPVMAAATFFGNVVNIMVFTFGKLPRSALNVLLLGLSVTECVQGACFFIFFSMRTFCVSCRPTTIHVFEKSADLFFYTSNWITMTLSVFRFISVSYPLKYRHLCTNARARMCLGLCLALNIAKESVYWFHHFATDEELIVVEPINQTVGRIIPCVVVLATTLLSIIKVDKMSKATSGISVKQGKSLDETRIIQMLLVLLFIFFATNTYCVVTLLCRIFKVPGVRHILYSEAIAFGLNSSMNVVLYFWMNPCYRRALYRVFRCPCRDRETLPLGSSSTLYNLRATTNLSRSPYCGNRVAKTEELEMIKSGCPGKC